MIDTGLGDYGEAMRLHRRMLVALIRDRGPRDPILAFPLTGLAEALASQGRHAEAVRYYERALAIRRAALGPTTYARPKRLSA